MTFASKLHIALDRLACTSPREKYWIAAATWAELRQLNADGNAGFRRHVQRDFASYLLGSIRPIGGENETRVRAAVDWILRGHRATPDDGVSLGYFPCSVDGVRWRPSYPETTGYIITSLLAFARNYGNAQARDAAIRMARWEASIQMASGAVQGGPIGARDEQTPASFNTGMVLDGWCSAYELTRDPVLLEAARRAANFLVDDLDEAGYYRTNGAFVKAGEIKTYTCLCAWPIYRLGDLLDEERYREAALRSVEAALLQQQVNGWFAHNCLTRSDAPLTHTLGYTLQGILEVGACAKREAFVTAVERTMKAVIPNIADTGFLPGMFFADWRPAAFSSCLTGAAQIAIIGYRLHEITRKAEYLVAADRLTDFLKALQALDADDENINGALAGSFPLFGNYMRGGYPNWATKYLLDALMLQDPAGGVGLPTSQAASVGAASAPGIDRQRHRLLGDTMRIDVERVGTLKDALLRSSSSRFENCTPQDAIHELDSMPQNAKYHFVPASVQQMWKRIAEAHGDDVLATFNQVLLLTLIEDFDVRIRTRRYPQSIIDQFHVNFQRIIVGIASGISPSYRSRSDIFMKDLAICRQKLVPAGAEVLAEHAGIPRRTLFAGGPAQFASLLMFFVSQRGRNRPFYEYHTHRSTMKDFNQTGFDAFYLRVAELLKLNLDVRGLTASAWFLDPVLEMITPGLAYIRTRPMEHGAKLFVVGPDMSGSAISKSAARQKLYEQGRYKPMVYRIVWPRRQLMAWADRHAA